MSWSWVQVGPITTTWGFLAVFVELFGRIDREVYRLRLALVGTVFFVIELDHPNVAVAVSICLGVTATTKPSQKHDRATV